MKQEEDMPEDQYPADDSDVQEEEAEEEYFNEWEEAKEEEWQEDPDEEEWQEADEECCWDDPGDDLPKKVNVLPKKDHGQTGPYWINKPPSRNGRTRSGYKIFVGDLPPGTQWRSIKDYLWNNMQDDPKDREAERMVTDVNMNNNGNTVTGDVSAFYDIMEKQLAAWLENNFL